MRTATYEEFEAALAKAKWPAAQRSVTGRVLTARYTDCGVEVAVRVTIETRGKKPQVTYYVNEAHLKSS